MIDVNIDRLPKRHFACHTYGVNKMGDQNRALHGNVPDTCNTALLLVDVLNDLDFPGAQPLVRAAPRLARNISALKRRCREAKVPAIYVNDNRNRWRSDASVVVKHCLGANVPGRLLVKTLIPAPDDYIVLKPKHSAFFSTPLETLLLHLHTRSIILVGLTTDACILTTACEIHIRDLNLYVPSDCVAASSRKQHKMALELMKKSFGARVTVSRQLNLKRLLSRGS
jgi:nicotinamidase-related amidase